VESSSTANHAFATVYQRNRMTTTDPAELAKAILGSGARHVARPDQLHPTASKLFQPESDCDADAGPSGQQTLARRARRQGMHVSAKLPHASRGSPKGG
jgi:hypothetical protein